jgi:hypothetical protein
LSPNHRASRQDRRIRNSEEKFYQCITKYKFNNKDHSCTNNECCEEDISTENNTDNSADTAESKQVEICCHHTHEYKQILTIPTRECEDVISYEVEKFLIKLYNNCLVDKIQNHRYLIISSFEKYVIIANFR